MDVPTYEIFYGEVDNGALWLESVTGLADAEARMKQVAVVRPGRYFVYDIHTTRVLATTDTCTRNEPSRFADRLA